MRALVLLCLALAGCSPGSRFEQSAWKNADLTGRARADMLDDYLERYPLVGQTRGEVISKLGHPTVMDKWKGVDMIYVLGNDGSYMSIDHAWLLIDLDEDGRVASYNRAAD